MIDDFGGSSIAFVAGSTADLDSRARAPASAKLVPVENQKQGMAMLALRRYRWSCHGRPGCPSALHTSSHVAFEFPKYDELAGYACFDVVIDGLAIDHFDASLLRHGV